MFPNTAKLYMAPISDSLCYDERFDLYVSRNFVTSIDKLCPLKSFFILLHLYLCIVHNVGSH